jgi:hypothetical protein
MRPLAAAIVSAALAGTVVLAPRTAVAQGLEGYGGGPKIYLNKDSTSFLRITLWSQVWARWQQKNPGTMINNNPDTEESKDLGIRRTRILMHGQITPKLLVFWIIGVNNQTFTTGGLQGGDIGGGTSGIDGKRPQVFAHDSWGEYTFNKGLQVGGGILTWSGLSRMTNAATLNFLMADAPIFNWTTIDATDQFARTMGAYAKGSLGKLNYRAVLTRPFAIVGGQQGATTAPVTVTLPATAGGGTAAGTVNVGDNAATNALVATPARFNIANWNPVNNTLMTQLYVNYDFLEQESQVLPFTVGSYLGTKRVFNIGAGFQNHPAGMRYVAPRAFTGTGAARRAVLPTDAANPAPTIPNLAVNDSTYNGDWVEAPMRHWAVDAFLDLPLGHDGDAVTVHSAYYNMDYGPNYVRNIGIMPVGVANPATRIPAGQPNAGQFQFQQPGFAGGGAGYPIHGTGSVWYTQAGYLLPKSWTRGFNRLQPTGALSVVSFERLGEGYVMPELGINWILGGQNAKITLQWRRRPIYDSPTRTNDNLAPVIPTAVAPATNQAFPLQTGMRRTGARNDILLQFHVHF